MSKYNWMNVHDLVNVITTDFCGRKEFWWMWNGALPKLGTHGWYDQYRGRCIDSFRESEFEGNWKDSLEERPK